jgi:hypothetical protein
MLLIVVFAIGGKSLLLLFAKRQVGYTAARLATDLRLELLRAIMRSRWEYFLGQPVGKLTNALATEAARASESFVNGATALTFLAQAVVYGAVAIAVSWRATLTGIVAGAVIIGLSHSLVRITKKAGRKQTSVLLSLMATMTDTLGSVKPLKGMGREHLADAVLSMETTRLNRALERQALGSALLESTQEFLFALVIAGGIYVALAEIRDALRDGDGAGGGGRADGGAAGQGAEAIPEDDAERERLLVDAAHHRRGAGRGRGAARRRASRARHAAVHGRGLLRLRRAPRARRPQPGDPGRRAGDPDRSRRAPERPRSWTC